MKPEPNKYLDVLKVLEFGAEGGGESLYRLLPYGEARFVWRTYGNSIGEDDAGQEIWADFTNEYEDIVEYLNDREQILAALHPLHIDSMFRAAVFAAFLRSLRGPTPHHTNLLFREMPKPAPGERPFSGWPLWQSFLQLPSEYDTITVYSAFGKNPIVHLTVEYGGIKNVQQLLNLIYNAFLSGLKQPGTYGKEWFLYDLIACREIILPRDDRDDTPASLGISSGGTWVVYEVAQ